MSDDSVRRLRGRPSDLEDWLEDTESTVDGLGTGDYLLGRWLSDVEPALKDLSGEQLWRIAKILDRRVATLAAALLRINPGADVGDAGETLFLVDSGAQGER